MDILQHKASSTSVGTPTKRAMTNTHGSKHGHLQRKPGKTLRQSKNESRVQFCLSCPRKPPPVPTKPP